MIYLDYNATAPMKPAVRAAMLEAMERYGNPSSVHRYGRVARRHVEEARASVAAFAGVKPAQVIFTSGGTEANNMVLQGVGDMEIVTSSIEHDSVLAVVPDAQRLPVTREGVVDLDMAARIIKSLPKRSLISVMLVNNETGVIQPVAEIARMAKEAGHLVHTDAVQAAGRLPIDFASLGVDFMTLSAHKIGGPQGIGALIVSEKAVLQSMLKGGGQEMNRRAGTENVPGIIGFGSAALLAADDLLNVPRLAGWRDALQKQLQNIGGDNVVIAGAQAPRIASTLLVALRGVGSETQVMSMDLAGVAVSSGAACSSGKVKPSHVLRAMEYSDDIAGSTVRISLGWNTQETDIVRCIEAWRALYERTCNQRQQAA
jgi:cysteine desulfurase